MKGIFSRLTVLVIGPGLSRDPVILDTAKRVILRAREKNLPLVIDAVWLNVLFPRTVSFLYKTRPN